MNLSDPLDAERFIKQRFAATPERLGHILVVADRVRQSARDINELNPGMYIDESTAYCAALLHDIGELEEVTETGFSPVDGYNYLSELGFAHLGALILEQGAAPEEAQLLGMDEIIPVGDPISDLITYWDLRVGPGGRARTFDELLQETVERHGKDSIASRAYAMAEPRIREIFRRIETLLQQRFQ